jgi:TraM recognition site of TraD and TraG
VLRIASGYAMTAGRQVFPAHALLTVPHTDFKRSHAQIEAVAAGDTERRLFPQPSASPSVACVDELPSTSPLPKLRTRMASESALGVSFIYAVQTWRQLAAVAGRRSTAAGS